MAASTLYTIPVGQHGSWRGRNASRDRNAAEILAIAANRSLVLVVRDTHRSASIQDLVTAVLADRPDTVLVEMGLPVWQPPEVPAPT